MFIVDFLFDFRMKFGILVFLSITCCLYQYISAYKIVDADFLQDQDTGDILYPANRQGSLYDEPNDPISYQRALAALEAIAKANRFSNDDDEMTDDVDSSDLEELLENSYLNENNFNGEISADPRGDDEETESHSSLGAGHQYVSGGAGEGKQHLKPNGAVPNKEEVKSDEDLPAYCNPPNPCPVGYTGEGCDRKPFEEYTAEYSKAYQEEQNCMCDNDHNECQNTSRRSKSDRVSDIINDLENPQVKNTT